MKHKYTAKIYLDDGEAIFTSGNDIEELIAWLNSQAEASFGELNGEIIDNATQEVVKHFQYVPPE